MYTPSQPVSSGVLEQFLVVGCQIDISDGATFGFGSSFGPNANVTISGQPGVSVGGSASVSPSISSKLKPGTINEISLGKKTLQTNRASIREACATDTLDTTMAAPAGIASAGQPGSLRQGGLGDCWLLATIAGYQLSDTGRRGLERLVTPSASGGYDVRLSFNNQRVTRHVDSIYPMGATQDGQYGIAALFEAAVSQSDESQVECGGYARNAQKMFSGERGEHYEGGRFYTNKMRDRLTNDAGDINSRIQNGTAVVLGTGGKSDFDNFLTSKMTPSDQIEERFTDVAISSPINESPCL